MIYWLPFASALCSCALYALGYWIGWREGKEAGDREGFLRAYEGMSEIYKRHQ